MIKSIARILKTLISTTINIKPHGTYEYSNDQWYFDYWKHQPGK